MLTRLSLCAIAHDEEVMLPGLLRSVAGLVDEIVIGIDTRSTDRTESIACSYGAVLRAIDWRDDFSYARNITLDAATGKWILVLDADERLLPEGAAAIREVIDNASEVPAPDAVTGIVFWISQRDLDERQRVIQLGSSRLFRNRPEIRYRGIIHEEIQWLPDPSLTTGMIIDPPPAFAHYGYDRTIWEQRGKYERNRRLLERRIAENPDDDYARRRLLTHETLAP